MNRRAKWKRVLEDEVQRWSLIPWDGLVEKLQEADAYTLSYDGKKYQVEVQILERSDTSVHFLISVDDGMLPQSIFPASRSLLRHRPESE